MIKRLISEYIQRRRDKIALRDKRKTKFPTAHLYYGESVKRVDEDGICFEYDHMDCFLADSELNANSFVRLTGEGAATGNLDAYSIKEDEINGTKYKIFYLGDLYGAYYIDTRDKFGYNGYMTLEDITEQLNWLNTREKARAKEEILFDIKETL
ncbi:MAG: hypothetical protein IKC49_02470 [Clostridia bacterium]|nr:hypothetical protein [Clostridia bacterium]